MSKKNKAKKGFSSVSKMIFPVVKFALPIVAFFEQVSAKDRQNQGAAYSNADTITQLKMLINFAGGRVVGISPFKSLPSAPQTLNPSGVWNKWTQGGALALLYSVVGSGVNKLGSQMGVPSLLPHTGKFKTLGKGAISGGIVGGFFDDPIDTQKKKSVGNFAPSLTNQNSAGARQLQVTRSFSTIDSVKSGMA